MSGYFVDASLNGYSQLSRNIFSGGTDNTETAESLSVLRQTSGSITFVRTELCHMYHINVHIALSHMYHINVHAALSYMSQNNVNIVLSHMSQSNVHITVQTNHRNFRATSIK